jgi:hypothetical protein
VNSPIPTPVFGVGFHNEHGVHIAGPNSQTSDMKIDNLEGDGYVDFAVDNLPLAPGRYEVSAAIVDQSLLHVYDYRDRAFDLTVQPGHAADVVGVISLDGRWSSPTTAQHHVGPVSPTRSDSTDREDTA